MKEGTIQNGRIVPIENPPSIFAKNTLRQVKIHELSVSPVTHDAPAGLSLFCLQPYCQIRGMAILAGLKLELNLQVTNPQPLFSVFVTFCRLNQRE
jgi:hypothetical protein